MSALLAPILVTRRIPPAGLERLREHGLTFDLHDSDEPLGYEALCRRAAGRGGIICQIADRFDAALLAAVAPTCRVIATVSVGYDHIDIAAARQAGILIANTPDVLTETTADLTWALLMAAARRVAEGDRFVRSGRWKGWGMLQLLGVDVHGATLGIVGGGRIGGAVARRAGGFNMRVLCHSRSGASAHMPAGAAFVDLPTLLGESDFVSLHCPLTPQTHHLIGAAEIALMKPTAILINAARGPVVDEPALIAALRDGRIAGAGLDVFEHEPTVPAELLALENVVVLPHIGSASRRTRETMACMCADAVADGLAGRRPKNLV